MKTKYFLKRMEKLESNPESEGATAMKDYGKTVKFTPEEFVKMPKQELKSDLEVAV